jgi:ribosomal protein L12E/L44/L45/RPP1/RPP2
LKFLSLFQQYITIMKHLAAYLLLQLGGRAEPSKEDVTRALSAVGIEVDEERLTKLMSDLEGKDVSELLESGRGMLATLGGGGGGGGGAAGGGGGGGDAGAAAAEQEKEPEEEEEMAAPAVDMFGGGDEGDY